MKIVLINTLYHPNMVGGAEKSTQFLAEALQVAGHEVVVITAEQSIGIRTDTVGGVKVYYIGIKNIYWPYPSKTYLILKLFWHIIDTYNPFMASEIEKILLQEQPDIVHTSNLACFSVAVWHKVKKHHLPLVHTIRDHYLSCPRSTMFKNGHNCKTQCMECRIFAYIRKYFSRYVDSVVGISKYILDKHISMGYFTQAYTEVIHNSLEQETECIENVVKNDEEIIFGYFGRLDSLKGVELLVDTFNKMGNSRWRLKIAGTGHNKYIEKLKLGSRMEIEYIGFLNPEDFYPQIDVLIVPSLWNEPLGRIVFEAYSYGIPVIGSNRGGIPEIIEHGRTGFIFEPDNEYELLDLINGLLDNPSCIKTFKSRCLEKAKEFLPERIIQKYIKIYEQLLE